MDLVLIHGMGRTPLSMLRLRHRLRRQGHRAHLFAYVSAFESMSGVTQRLVARIQRDIGNRPYALVGHSLGCVLIRNALPQLSAHPPRQSFFMAPPMRVCRVAKFFAPNFLYRLITREMGQLLTQEAFMAQLPLPDNLTIYAGTAGPRGAWYPFAGEVNDSILTLSEASAGPPARMVLVPVLHTFIMHSKMVSADILQALRKEESADYSE